MISTRHHEHHQWNLVFLHLLSLLFKSHLNSDLLFKKKRLLFTWTIPVKKQKNIRASDLDFFVCFYSYRSEPHNFLLWFRNSSSTNQFFSILIFLCYLAIFRSVFQQVFIIWQIVRFSRTFSEICCHPRFEDLFWFLQSICCWNLHLKSIDIDSRISWSNLFKNLIEISWFWRSIFISWTSVWAAEQTLSILIWLVSCLW